MKKVLEYLFAHQRLDKNAARMALLRIGRGEANPSQMAAFLTVYLMRFPGVEELEGFREALLELCKTVNLDCGPVTDLCGTGGDGKDTFNISTLAAFVVAGDGIKVAKHGNYGVSSVSGSSNVMEAMGHIFTSDNERLKRQIHEAGICFLHAPLFHPAMKNVAPVRKELGIKTFFNMLGPLVNPARPVYQCSGVYSPELARVYRYLLQRNGHSFRIVHSMDGYDEISLTGKFKILHEGGEFTRSPEELGMKRLSQHELHGGKDTKEAALIFQKVLDRGGTEAQRNVVIANAALAISCAGKTSMEDGLVRATASLEEGKAKNVFRKLMAL